MEPVISFARAAQRVVHFRRGQERLQDRCIRIHMLTGSHKLQQTAMGHIIQVAQLATIAHLRVNKYSHCEKWLGVGMAAISCDLESLETLLTSTEKLLSELFILLSTITMLHSKYKSFGSYGFIDFFTHFPL